MKNLNAWLPNVWNFLERQTCFQLKVIPRFILTSKSIRCGFDKYTYALFNTKYIKNHFVQLTCVVDFFLSSSWSSWWVAEKRHAILATPILLTFPLVPFFPRSFYRRNFKQQHVIISCKFDWMKILKFREVCSVYVCTLPLSQFKIFVFISSTSSRT